MKSASLCSSSVKTVCSLRQMFCQGRIRLRPSIIWDRNEGGMVTMCLQTNLKHAIHHTCLCLTLLDGFSILPPSAVEVVHLSFELPGSHISWQLQTSPSRPNVLPSRSDQSQGCSVCTAAQDTLQGTDPVGAGMFCLSIFPWLCIQHHCSVLG